MTAKPLTQEEIIQLNKDVEEFRAKYDFIRKGQALFICLERIRVDIADEIRTIPDADPFYSDRKIELFWKFITE